MTKPYGKVPQWPHAYRQGTTEDDVDELVKAGVDFFNLHRNAFYGSGADLTVYLRFHQALKLITGKPVGH